MVKVVVFLPIQMAANIQSYQPLPVDESQLAVQLVVDEDAVVVNTNLMAL